jgi:hypothetical protein
VEFVNFCSELQFSLETDKVFVAPLVINKSLSTKSYSGSCGKREAGRCLEADFGGGLFKRASHDSKVWGVLFLPRLPLRLKKWSLLTTPEYEYRVNLVAHADRQRLGREPAAFLLTRCQFRILVPKGEPDDT